MSNKNTVAKSLYLLIPLVLLPISILPPSDRIDHLGQKQFSESNDKHKNITNNDK